jgi:carboxypeptidase family protein
MRTIFAAVTIVLLSHGVAAAQRTAPGTLRIVVHDPSGAVVPNARVQIKGDGGDSIGELVSDAQGVAVATGLAPGRYVVEASFPGFETRVVPDVRVRAGENRRDVVLAIQKIAQTVAVGRDPAIAASDPNNDRFNAVLSKQQIDTLPDDPDEMEEMLKQMAGPGATIRVDGFRGGKLPPKSQIRSIRFARDLFAAENHGGGMVFVDITTQPGLGPLTGSLDFSFRDDALNARNAFVGEKGPEQTQQYTFSLSGTLLKGRTSFSLSAGGASLYDSANIFAAVPGGQRSAAIRRPSDRMNFTGRVDHALSKSQTVRATFQQNDNEQQNLGVGGFDLPERAYQRKTQDTLFRVAESGAWSRNIFAESRLQLHSTSLAAASTFELPTIRVLDAFTAGGAQQAGGRRATEFEWATNVDWARGHHAVRTGALVEGGSFRSDTGTNYLGTYTFASLADYDAGRPSDYTRRTGDPLVEYSHWQAGVFVQDDWRTRKNLTLSGGLRYELQSHLPDRVNVAPRGGFTWSPFKTGKTTVRGGGGVFYDWLDADTFEQTLRVDGTRQQDLVVRNPGYPDPYSGGAATEFLPPSKYALARGLLMPRRTMVNVGVGEQLSRILAANVSVMHSTGTNRLRGRNVNAPFADGMRPDPAAGNITEVESTGRLRGTSVNAGVNLSIPTRRTFLLANYSWIQQKNDADGPFSLPADSYDLSGEWGPAAGVPHHLFSGIANTTLPRNIRVGVAATARTGLPYNITAGRDDNGDTVFNDRPSGIRRNSATTQGMWDVAARLSYAFGFGQRPISPGAPAGPTMIVQRVGGTAGAGDMLGAMNSGGADGKRIRVEVFVYAQNLFNHVNPIAYSGVMTSPFFGQPTAAMPARKIDVGVRIGF